ncbi:unnamed protein product [Cuscuta epithymum]|uniref:Uncharacterized protein n=1 Tax=Cuscuta epithymum TaxID=186058 RepID=A0AAV0F2B2_9ASTE|nr:unnamed protein product [Cuscuta epithymum]
MKLNQEQKSACNGCGYFQWYNENDMHCDEFKMEKDIVIDKLLAEDQGIVIEKLVAEKKILEEKVQKLKNKNKKMSVKITEVQMMASKSAKGERNTIMVVLVSWIVFGILGYLK